MEIGIDLGTSYSSVAAKVNDKIEMIRVATGASAFGDSFSMPTAVYMDNGHMLLGQAAINKRRVSPSCFKSEFKRDLGTSTPYIINGEEYLPEQLYTELLLYFKDQVFMQTGEKIEKAYITHPANYGNNKKRLIERAAANAGLFDIVLVDEPTAAAAGYSCKSKISYGDIILVYDLGGGTFDAALIKKTPNGYIHLTEPLGISQCGGTDFDRAIFDDIMRKISESGNFDMDWLMHEKRFTAALSEICVQIKHQLSQADSHMEPIAVGYDYFDYTITRQEFENMIRPLIASTCEKVKDILKNSGLTATDIDRVLLVGGSSRIPLVREMVCSTLQKKDIYFDADPELAVCQGAVSLIIVPKDEAHHENLDEGLRNQDKKVDNGNVKRETNTQEYKKAEPYKEIQQVQKASEKIENNTENRIEYIKEDQNKTQKQDNQIAGKNIIVQKHEPAESAGRMKEIMTGVLFGDYAFDGEWIYYVEEYDEKHFKTNRLYKIKMDGTQKNKINNQSTELPIKVEGNWVYYPVYMVDKKASSFYKIKKNGESETLISKAFKNQYGCYDKLNYDLKNGWIWFADDSGSLIKLSVDSTNSVKVCNALSGSYIIAKRDFIYYRSGDKISKIGIDGRNGSEICNAGYASIFTVYNNEIFYLIFEKERKLFKEISWYDLWKINTDGTGKYRVINDFKADKIKIIDGWFYYEYMIYLYRMRPDGTQVQELKPEMLQQAIIAMSKS